VIAFCALKTHPYLSCQFLTDPCADTPPDFLFRRKDSGVRSQFSAEQTVARVPEPLSNEVCDESEARNNFWSTLVVPFRSLRLSFSGKVRCVFLVLRIRRCLFPLKRMTSFFPAGSLPPPPSSTPPATGLCSSFESGNGDGRRACPTRFGKPPRKRILRPLAVSPSSFGIAPFPDSRLGNLAYPDNEFCASLITPVHLPSVREFLMCFVGFCFYDLFRQRPGRFGAGLPPLTIALPASLVSFLVVGKEAGFGINFSPLSLVEGLPGWKLWCLWNFH